MCVLQAIIIQEYKNQANKIIMALINCPECGKEVSSAAKQCPYCGYPIKDRTSVISDVSQNKNHHNSSRKNGKAKKAWIVGVVVVVVVALVVGAILFLSGTGNRSIEKYRAEAEKFKSELPKSYVVLAECIDSAAQKIYYTNVVTDSYGMAGYPPDSIPFINVYDLNTQKTTSITSHFESEYELWFGVSFYYYKNEKLFIAAPDCRDGSNLYYVNIYTDEVECLDNSCMITKVRVEGDKIIYTKAIQLNDTEFLCDREWGYKDYTIQI